MKKSLKARRSKPYQDALHRTFGDLEVRDAKDDLRVAIHQGDVAKGKRKDPENCALAQACMREFDSTAAVFFKSRAYVDVLGEDGVRRVERFVLSPEARKIVASFDGGRRVPAGGRLIVLSAPAPSETLNDQLRRYHKRQKALRKGEIDPSTRKGPSTPRIQPKDVDVRNGAGQWQMIRREKAAAQG